jgi:hypothetical protein
LRQDRNTTGESASLVSVRIFNLAASSVASLPCNKNDLGEASWLRRLQELSPDLAEKARKEASQAAMILITRNWVKG